ncbi:MAG TPA: hypothetical protein VFS55_06160 [Dokdonella sp.]|nr:hypothetical protein [Dokdonella sp.]
MIEFSAYATADEPAASAATTTMETMRADPAHAVAGRARARLDCMDICDSPFLKSSY